MNSKNPSQPCMHYTYNAALHYNVTIHSLCYNGACFVLPYINTTTCEYSDRPAGLLIQNRTTAVISFQVYGMSPVMFARSFELCYSLHFYFVYCPSWVSEDLLEHYGSPKSLEIAMPFVNGMVQHAQGTCTCYETLMIALAVLNSLVSLQIQLKYL